jgi:hypothetical protein
MYVDLSVFVLLEVCWASWMCRLLLFTNLESFQTWLLWIFLPVSLYASYCFLLEISTGLSPTLRICYYYLLGDLFNGWINYLSQVYFSLPPEPHCAPPPSFRPWNACLRPLCTWDNRHVPPCHAWLIDWNSLATFFWGVFAGLEPWSAQSPPLK